LLTGLVLPALLLTTLAGFLATLLTALVLLAALLLLVLIILVWLFIDASFLFDFTSACEVFVPECHLTCRVKQTRRSKRENIR